MVSAREEGVTVYSLYGIHRGPTDPADAGTGRHAHLPAIDFESWSWIEGVTFNTFQTLA
jgi:hypothetical protein